VTLEWRNALDEDFLTLTRALDACFRERIGVLQDSFDPYNRTEMLSDVALILDGPRAVACAALRLHPDRTAELKRVFVLPEYRRKGLARRLVAALENKASAHGCTKLLLETNPAFEDAKELYLRIGFEPVCNFGPYLGMDTLCMGKALLSCDD
jgi:putative acetyltransferase